MKTSDGFLCSARPKAIVSSLVAVIGCVGHAEFEAGRLTRHFISSLSTVGSAGRGGSSPSVQLATLPLADAISRVAAKPGALKTPFLLYQRHLQYNCYPIYLGRQPPRPQGQRLYPHHRRLDERPKCYRPDYDTNNVCHVVAVRRHVADATSVPTSVLVSFKRAREGLRDELALEIAFRRSRGRLAGGNCEDIDELEHKVSWESAA